MDNPNKKLNAYLIIHAQVFPLIETETMIGRSLTNDLVLNEASVSREHAKITLENGEYMLHDMDSTGGCFVNGKRVKTADLRSGDLLHMADIPMMFVLSDITLVKDTEKPTGNLSDHHENTRPIRDLDSYMIDKKE